MLNEPVTRLVDYLTNQLYEDTVGSLMDPGEKIKMLEVVYIENTGIELVWYPSLMEQLLVAWVSGQAYVYVFAYKGNTPVVWVPHSKAHSDGHAQRCQTCPQTDRQTPGRTFSQSGRCVLS